LLSRRTSITLVVANRGAYQSSCDVGYAEDGFEERTSTPNGEPAVTLVVSKQSGQNTVAVPMPSRRASGTGHAAAGISHAGCGRPVDIHQGLDRNDSGTPDPGQLAAVVVFLFLWSVRSTMIAHRYSTSLIATFENERHRLHAQSNHHAGPDTMVNRNRRRHCGTGKYFPFY
jgi:hypothetical protein